MFTLKDFLREEVKPALGCTEPGAVALCVARACEEFKDRLIESIEVTTSASIYKNGMYVGIPGTNGLKGNYVAAALGAVCGKSALGLEVLKPCSSEAVKDALKMLDEGRIRIIPEMERSGVFVKAVVVSTSGEQAVCIIEGSHTNITRVEKDEEIVEMVETDNATERLETARLSVSEQIAGMSYYEVLKVLDNMNASDVEYIMDGVEMNTNIAEYGFANNIGLEYGSLIQDLAKSSLDEEAGLPTKIKAWCAAAADAEWAGRRYRL